MTHQLKNFIIFFVKIQAYSFSRLNFGGRKNRLPFSHNMRRFLLLSLSVLSFHLFGKITAPTTFTETFSPPRVAAVTDKHRPEADTIPPVIQCPDLDTVTILTQGTCDTVLHFNVTATDDQGQAIIIQLSGPKSGDVFPLGATTSVFLATDLAGNTATCALTITVRDSVLDLLYCKDLDTVLLNANCLYQLRPLDVLEGGPYGCWDHYTTELDKTAPFGNGPWLSGALGVADIGKTYQARITNTQNGTKCWGNVRIFDKTPPTIQCNDLYISCMESNTAPAYLRDSLGISNAYPTATDACSPVSVLGYLENQVPGNCDTPFTKLIRRTWQANDESGNSSTCLQVIHLHRHTLNEVQIPVDFTLDCPDTTILPAVTGVPYVVFQGARYDMENNSICDISAFYTDSTLTLPCGNREIIRKWELFDFCSSGVASRIQHIYIKDNSKPSVSCPASLMITVAADTCKALVDLPDAMLGDNCSHLAGLQAFWEDGGLAKSLVGSVSTPSHDSLGFHAFGNLGMALLPVGTTSLTYVAEDSCGNEGDCIFNITVADMEKPVVACESFLTLPLQEDGLLAIGATVLDNGSADACTTVAFKAKLLELTECQYDTLWGDSLRFCCLNSNDTLLARLRVYDIPVGAGTVSESFGAGHYSECTVKLLVKDPNPPECVAPSNVTVDCQAFDPTLETYGTITSNSCAVDSLALEVDYSQFDTACNKGLITRIFKVYDAAGNVGGCAQAVQVNYLQDYYVKFPDDVIQTVCDGTNNYGQPAIFNLGCDDFKVEYTDETFTVVPDACYKIERTWKVTNRCSYNPAKPLVVIPNPQPNAVANSLSNLPGPIVASCSALAPWSPTIIKINFTDLSPTNYCTFWSDTVNGYTYKQIIKVVDGQAPTGTYDVPACNNQSWTSDNNIYFWNNPQWIENGMQSHDLCEEPTTLSITGVDACPAGVVDISYLLFLDLDDDGITETVINSQQLGAGGLGWNNVRFNNLNTPNYSGGTPTPIDDRSVPANQKVGFAIEKAVSGSTMTAYVRWNTEADPNTYYPAELPHGTHKIRWTIMDQCGNSKNYEYPFTIKDCKPPSLACQDSLNVNIQSNHLANLSASYMLQYADDNCTPVDLIKLAIRKCGSGSGFPADGNGNPQQSVTYNCTELGQKCVEVWAMDLEGNSDHCETTINITDDQENCTASGDSLYGRIVLENGTGIQDVILSLSGSCLFCPPVLTGITTDMNGNYTATLPVPSSPDYKLEAGKDINPLNGVTTYDLVLISKHILGIEPLNSPYKIISADVNKSGSVTSFDIVETRKLILGINATFNSNTSWRFVDSAFVFPNPQNPFQTGIPDTILLSQLPPYNFIGMKVGDVNLSAVPNAQAAAQDRFDGTVFLNVENQKVKAGQVFEATFEASEVLQGFQFTLDADGLEILDILPASGMSRDQFAVHDQNHTLTAAWETGGKARFTIRFAAQRDGSLQEMLRLNSRVTPAEAYPLPAISRSSVKAKMELNFGAGEQAFELFQNRPNPFAKKTLVRFQLPQAGTAEISITDENGAVLWQQNREWPAGLNEMEIDLSEISASGVLYCRLKTAENSAIRKMIRI